ncbi:MAG: single-stranded-DNA-specific exonuclease RecJ [Patescibacteria group bacterium]
MEKKIKIGQELPEDVKKELSQYPEFLGKLLFYRDIKTQKEAEIFLNPNYEKGLFDPFLIKGMDVAVERILKAINLGEKILIFSDYDADGIPGAVILNDFLKKIGFFNFEVHIPNRLKTGYGFKKEILEAYKDSIQLIITIDSGITDVEAVEEANRLGMEVIITDHHQVNGKLPPALAILNSKQSDDNYPDDMLCGAGVVFKLISALISKGNFNLVEGWEKWLLDMVALATIADMVPLKNENRILALFGLKVMRKSRRFGLQKLLKKAWIKPEQLVDEDISFVLAPRINAASRISDPRIAFDLLATEDEVEAGRLADELDKLNNKRKTLVATAVREAKRKILKRDLKDVVVIGNPDWNVGISGLIASSLEGDYSRPVFVWGTDEDGKYCGSCRAKNLDLIELMNTVEKEVFTHIGGHKMAAGFGVADEQIYFLEEKLLQAFEKIKDKKIEEEIFVDKNMVLDEVNLDNFKLIEKLAPFGIGNSKPLFLFENVEIMDMRIFGKTNNHLELVFKNSKGGRIKAIQFFSEFVKELECSLKLGQKINFLAHIEKDNFSRNKELRLRIISIL